MNSCTPSRSGDDLGPVGGRQPPRRAAARTSLRLRARRVGPPSTRPTPCTHHAAAARLAVTRGSFCRSEPAAVLRGLANGALPASTSDALSSSKRATGKNTSPRTSSTRGHVVAGQPVGDVVDRADVGRDVLAGAAVAAGGAADQPAVLVDAG